MQYRLLIFSLMISGFLSYAQPGEGYLLPRVRDTLDGYSWRYFGMVPAWQDVTSARIERTSDGAVLRAQTPRGEVTMPLTADDVEVLAEYLDEYESATRKWNDPGDSISVTDARMLHPRSMPARYARLMKAGVVEPLRFPIIDPSNVSITMKEKWSIRGLPLFADDSSIVLLANRDGFDWSDNAIQVRRLLFRDIEEMSFYTPGSFWSGFSNAMYIGGSILGSAGIREVMYSESGKNAFPPLAVVIFSALVPIPLALCTGWITWAVGTRLILTSNHDGTDVASNSTAIRSWCIFPSVVPPQIRSRVPECRNKDIERMLVPPSVEIAITRADLTAVDIRGRGIAHAFAFALDFGVNIYETEPRTPLNEYPSGEWIGVSANVKHSLGEPGTFGERFAIRSNLGAGIQEHIGSGLLYLRGSIECLMRFNNTLYLFTGLDCHYLFQNASWESYGFKTVLNTSRFVDNLFLPVGLGLEFSKTFFEIQYRFSLGKPIRVLDRSAGSDAESVHDERGYRSFGLTWGWKL